MAKKVSLKNVTIKWANIKPKEVKSNGARYVFGKSITLLPPSEEAVKILEFENTAKEAAVNAINIAIKASNPNAASFRADKLNYDRKKLWGYDSVSGNDTVEVKLTRVPSEKTQEVQSDGTIKEITSAGLPDEEGNYKELICNRVYESESDLKGSFRMPVFIMANGEETEYIPYGGSIADVDLFLDAKVDIKKMELNIYASADIIKVTQGVDSTKTSSKNSNIVNLDISTKDTPPTEASKTTKKTTKAKVEAEENAVNKAVDYALSELVD